MTRVFQKRHHILTLNRLNSRRKSTKSQPDPAPVMLGDTVTCVHAAKCAVWAALLCAVKKADSNILEYSINSNKKCKQV